MLPSFENFLLDILISEQKLSVKKKRSTGVDFEIYRSGRVEKILTCSISGMKLNFDCAATSTDDVQQKYYLWQAIEAHREQFPNFTKVTLEKTFS